MPHEVLTTYLKQIESAVACLPNVYVERYEEEIIFGRGNKMGVFFLFSA